MSERSTFKCFGIPTLLQGAVLLFLCPVILFNGMYILNNGFVFQEGVEVGKLFALAGMLLFPSLVVTLLLEKSETYSSKYNKLLFLVVFIVVSWVLIAFPYEWMQQFN